MVILLSW